MARESGQVSAEVDIKASKGRSTCKGTGVKANMIMVTSLCIRSGVARGGGRGQLPPGADLRGAPKCLDVCYK